MRLFILLILLLISSCLSAQETVPAYYGKYLGFGIGLNFRQSRDHCLNPTRFQGMGFQGIAFFENLSDNTYKNLAFSLSFNKLANRYDFLPVSFMVSPDLSYSYAHKNISGNQLSNYSGVKLNTGTNIFSLQWDLESEIIELFDYE